MSNLRGLTGWRRIMHEFAAQCGFPHEPFVAAAEARIAAGLNALDTATVVRIAEKLHNERREA